MARPQKHEHEKRSEIVRFRVTPAEKEHLLSQANTCDLSASDYARRRVLGHTVAPLARPKFDPTLVNEINRIGVNVNQLALSVHTNRKFTQYWREIGHELESVLEKVVSNGA